MDQLRRPLYEFAGFRLDVFAQTLTATDGSAITLPSRAFDTLRVLVERAGELVEKAELMKAVWPKTVVEENNLSQCILAIRRALGDDAGLHKFVLTVPGRGFKFVATVRVLDPTAELELRHEVLPQSVPPPASATSTLARTGHFPRRLPLALVLLAACTALIVGATLWPGLRRPVSAPGTQVPAAVPTIAVLPFVNLSAQQNLQYLSDGLAEELIDLLTKIRALRVSARGSSFAFRDASMDIPTIAKRLGVAHVLEGSVRKDGQRLRVSVQLVQASTGTSVWSETYDRELRDVFAVEEDIANEVARALRLQLLAPRSIPGEQRTRSTDAYEQYLLGRQLLSTAGVDERWQAKAAFERALHFDPDFAPALAGLALAEVRLGGYESNRSWYDAGKAAADRALALAPDLVEAYVARGRAYLEYDWDWARAREDIDSAMRLDPNNVQLLRLYADYIGTTGSLQDCLEVIRLTVERNPLSGFDWGNLALAEMQAGDIAAARKDLQQVLSTSASPGKQLYIRSLIELRAGNYAEAVRLARQIDPGGTRDYILAMAAYSHGDSGEARAALQRLMTYKPDQGAYQLALDFAWQGNADAAFHWLDHAYAVHDSGLPALRRSPELQKLRDDPRFQKLLLQLKLPPA